MGDPKVSDGFFSTLVGLDAGEALERCRTRADELRAEVNQLQEQLGQTARADKQGAHAIRQAILHTQSKLLRLKPVISGYREALEKRDTHSLWVEGVRAVCGQDALREVYDWMAAEKKRRAIARKAEVQSCGS
jgi:NH3-dependent NAD+ synthetase